MHLLEVATNKITTKNMTDNNTSTKAEEPVQVSMKDPKKVAAGKRLAEFNHRRKKELAQKSKDQESEPNLSQEIVEMECFWFFFYREPRVAEK